MRRGLDIQQEEGSGGKGGFWIIRDTPNITYNTTTGGGCFHGGRRFYFRAKYELLTVGGLHGRGLIN